MRFLIVALLAGLAWGTVHADPVPKDKPKSDAEKLVGLWKVIKSGGTEVEGTTVEFTDKGAITIKMDGGDIELKGTYKLTKEGIDYTISIGEEKKSEVLKIKSLDNEKMKTEDPQGVEEEFERIVEKKKDDKKKDDKKKEEKKPSLN